MVSGDESGAPWTHYTDGISRYLCDNLLRMSISRLKSVVLIVLLSLPLSAAFGQDALVIVNIGFKFGYAITKESSMVGGIELSVNFYRDFKGIGFLVSTEQWSGRELDHYAIQVFYGLAGVSFGPAVMRLPTGTTSGYVGTLFGGAFVLPYYRYSFFRNDTNAHEMGLYAKLPLPVIYPKIRM